jgi:hypothetical protein
METVQSSGEAFITNAALGGRFVLRACIPELPDEGNGFDRPD